MEVGIRNPYGFVPGDELLTPSRYLSAYEDEVFPFYPADQLLADCHSLVYRRGRLRLFLRHFFQRIRYHYTRSYAKHTPWQVLHSEELMARAWRMVESKPTLFPEGVNNVNAIWRYFRLGLNGTHSVSNYPADEAYRLYNKWCPPGGNVYDPSCGFGSRLAACILSGRSYYGTDPNRDLMPCLEAEVAFLAVHGFITDKLSATLVCSGSEVYCPEWAGFMDLAFGSPPYYRLERYSDDGYASTSARGYRDWGKRYVIPTVWAIKRYLKPGGVAAINLRNGKDYPVYDDWFRAFERLGFRHEATETLRIERRYNVLGKVIDRETALRYYSNVPSKEDIMIFRRI